MTDRTQPEALRLANVCSNLTRYSMDAHLMAAELCRQHTHIAELEAQIAAAGAGGVQALSAAPKVAPAEGMTIAGDGASALGRLMREQRQSRLGVYPDGNPNAAHVASPTPPAEQQARWVERWHGSGGKEFWEGWSILNAANREMIAHLGPDVDPDAVRGIVAAHNEALCGECAGTGGRWCPACAGATPTAEQQAAPKAAPVVWLSSKQLRGITALHGQYLPFRQQPEGRFDTPVYLEESAPKAAPGDALDEAMRERDEAVDFIDAMLDEVLGHERPEWSNLYGRADALNDVQERMTALHKPSVDKAWGRFQSTNAAPQQEAQEPGEIPESIERMATGRYKVVPSHESMFHRWAVVAGSGTQQLYLGREVECQNMARKFAGAFLDGAFVAMQSTAPQPAPAPLSDDVLKKAARYDFLRDCDLDGMAEMYWPDGQVPTGDEFDAAIDAALAAPGRKQ